MENDCNCFCVRVAYSTRTPAAITETRENRVTRDFEVTYLWRPKNHPRKKRALRGHTVVSAKTIFELFSDLTAANMDGEYKPPIRIIRIEELPIDRRFDSQRTLHSGKTGKP